MSFKSIVLSSVIFVGGLGAGYVIFSGNNGQPARVEAGNGVAETAAVAPVSASGTALNEAAVRRIVEAYIIENPVVILQAVNDYQQNGQVRQIEAQAAPYLSVLLNPEGAPIIGDAAATVKIIEFFDYQCPHCKANFGVLQRLVAEDATVALMPKYLPILGNGDENDMSLYAARAAEAARLQGKFAPFHEALMASHLPISRESIAAVAAAVGLDVDQLVRDAQSESVATVIAQSRAIADEIGISQAGTPGYIIGGKVTIGASPDSYDKLKAMIEAARSAD